VQTVGMRSRRGGAELGRSACEADGVCKWSRTLELDVGMVFPGPSISRSGTATVRGTYSGIDRREQMPTRPGECTPLGECSL
jgi:hypothetical protein